ncbi:MULTISPECIES: glycosyltransferase family 4 protein [unclassified Pseudomonas]|uniref:Glycosyltransferase family 4 protein n=1 Tax=Pseudomonas sp. MYb327 TaxID=2745230 RepID=A0AAU8DWL0_9PSED
MRILHFFKTALPETMGGVEQVIHQIARSSSNYGATSDVLSLSANPAPNAIEMGGYLAYQAKLNFQVASTGFSFSAISMFRRLAKDADIIHYHFPWPFMDVLHFACQVKKPTLVSYHSDIVNQQNLLKLYQPLQSKFLKSVDRIVASSPNYLKSSTVLAPFADKVDIIPIGLDEKSFPEPAAERIEHWKNIVGKGFFLFVGVLRYYKGLHTLLDAAHQTNFPIVIVGSGPKESELKAQAIRLGLSNVFFLGALPDEDKVALLSLSGCVVFPSHLRSEAFGITLLEGAMFGKPLISCEIGTGTTYINIADETGLVVPPNDAIALRKAMRLIWENPMRASEMGLKAQQRFQQHFTSEKMVSAYVDVYRDVLR